MGGQGGRRRRRGIGGRAPGLLLGGCRLVHGLGRSALFLPPGDVLLAGAARGFGSVGGCRGRIGGRGACLRLGRPSRRGRALGKRGRRRGEGRRGWVMMALLLWWCPRCQRVQIGFSCFLSLRLSSSSCCASVCGVRGVGVEPKIERRLEGGTWREQNATKMHVLHIVFFR